MAVAASEKQTRSVSVLQRFQIQKHYTPLQTSVHADDPVWKAWRLMKESPVKVLPVLKNEKIVGLVSDRDIVQISGFNGGQSMPVKDAMSMDPLVVAVEDSLEEVLRWMLKKDQLHAVVVDEERQILGLFTWNDALKFILEFANINHINQLLSS
jgi:acetoin utilization protein AcuB